MLNIKVNSPLKLPLLIQLTDVNNKLQLNGNNCSS